MLRRGPRASCYRRGPAGARGRRGKEGQGSALDPLGPPAPSCAARLRRDGVQGAKPPGRLVDGVRSGAYRRASSKAACPGGGIGRRAGFRYLWPQGCGSSSLLLGTIMPRKALIPLDFEPSAQSLPETVLRRKLSAADRPQVTWQSMLLTGWLSKSGTP